MPPARPTGPHLRPDHLIKLSREPIVLLSQERRIEMVNPAFSELTGHDPADLVGLECRPHGPTRPGDLPGLAAAFCPPPEVMEGRPVATITWFFHKDGGRIDRQICFWPIFDRAEVLLGVFGFILPADASPPVATSDAFRLRVDLLTLRAEFVSGLRGDPPIGRGPEHRRLLEQIKTAALADTPLLIVGEPGTGKRHVARAIHAQGANRLMPLISYDTQALPAEVLERELFGGSAGPGLIADREPARLVAPAGSTVVLGDVSKLPKDIQGRLVNSLDAGARRARLIVTTSVDPVDLVRAELMRPDLFYALTTMIIPLRPLRERPGEIAILAQHFLERANLRGLRRVEALRPAAVELLRTFDWPSNLRELARVIDAAHAHAQSNYVEATDIPPEIKGHLAGSFLPHPAPDLASMGRSLRDRVEEFEKTAIVEALQACRQNKARAARQLGVNRPYLYRRMRDLGLTDDLDDVRRINGDDDPVTT